MYKVQQNYAMAKAHHETLEKILAENERMFIAGTGYTNPDGSVPERLYKIDDEAMFDEICAAFSESGLDIARECDEATRILIKAEDQLIEFGLSIIPEKERAVLWNNRKRITVRKKLIDIAFRLATTNVKGGRKDV